MAYVYDIFLSYKRHRESLRWLDEHFQPLLEYYVEEHAGERPKVFRDDQVIEAGDTWPTQLGTALGSSRVLVALWTKTYFHSHWCNRELALMAARERSVGLRSAKRPHSLVIPVVLHDCNDLPQGLAERQHVPMHDYFNVSMQRESSLREKLANLIDQKIAPAVVAAMRSAPRWKKTWKTDGADEMMSQFQRLHAPSQKKVPRL